MHTYFFILPHFIFIFKLSQLITDFTLMLAKRMEYHTECGWRGEGCIKFQISYSGQDTTIVTLTCNLCT